MTNNDMVPALGFMLIGMPVFLILTSITGISSSALITRAMKVPDERFSETSEQPRDISDSFHNSTDDDMFLGKSVSSEDLSW